jgi:hypothetical protein
MQTTINKNKRTDKTEQKKSKTLKNNSKQE